MKCENLKGYLDGQLGLFDRLLMLAHVRLCAPCRQNRAEWLSLSREIGRLEDEPVPSALKERLITDAVTAAASARARRTLPASRRPREQEVWKVRKALFAAGLVVILVAVGFWLLPNRQGDFALADVARAMSKVKSVHFVGWSSKSGEHRKFEGWVEGQSRMRVCEEGVEDVADDGEKLTFINYRGGACTATIKPSREFPGLEEHMGYLDLLVGPNALASALKLNAADLVGSEPVALPDGRKVIVFELASGKRKGRLTVDAETNLVVKWEAFDKNGEVVYAIERFEYNVEIPESVFSITIPSDAIVSDLRSAGTSGSSAGREALSQKLRAAGGRTIGKLDTGQCGSSAHPGFRFRCLSKNGIEVYYFPDRNVYHVMGKALVYDHDGSSGFRQIVEDGEIHLPGKPHPIH